MYLYFVSTIYSPKRWVVHPVVYFEIIESSFLIKFVIAINKRSRYSEVRLDCTPAFLEFLANDYFPIKGLDYVCKQF